MAALRKQSTPTDPSADAIVRDLETRRRFGAAKRVAYLLSLDGDDPDEEPVNIESLHWFAELLKRHFTLPDPRIGVKPNGLVQIEWLLDPPGILALTFLTDGLIRIYAAFDEPESLPNCTPVNSTLTPAEAEAAMQPFVDRLPHR